MEGRIPGTIWIALFLLLLILSLEILNPKIINESFSLLSPVDVSGQDTNFFASFIPRRGDVGLNKEEPNYTRDPRYFSGYVDVQNYGVNHDFCRLVVPSKIENKDDSNLLKNAFFACALAGTSGLSSVSYRTKSVSEGLRLSRDDYMRTINDNNLYAYCRILKHDSGTFQPLCLTAKSLGFNDVDEIDPNPPVEVLDMLTFYDGCVAWLRLYDDMIDYTNTLIIQKGGNINIPEDPNPTITRGLSFNGIDQYLRISDTKDLTLGRKINMRNVRAFSLWIYFDAFTNNAHIFDFGDGAGNNNTVLSILGKGDATSDSNTLRPVECGNEQNTLPDYPSGPHPCAETSPQNLMLLKANVNKYECKLFEITPKRLTWETGKKKGNNDNPTRATLLYEIWDSKQRRQRILVNNVIPLKKWCHIVITAKSNDSFRPDVGIYINGTQVYLQPSGYLPQARSTTNNYIGKSNWSNQTSQYELKDELFSGKVFDFRMYNSVLSEEKIKKTIVWGQKKLGLT
jgi:hypothetical protein